jgi:peptide/nickel transport system substrate-binding protein
MNSLTRRGFGGLIASAAASGISGHAQAAGGLLRVRISSDISNLDPARIFQIENQTVAGHIYNGLVKYDQATNKIVPDLATSWEVSDGGTVYTFKLHDGVTWHKNFGKFTSDDVKFSIERVKNPATHSAYTGQFNAISSVEAPDPLTVRIMLEKPNPGVLQKLTAFNQGWMVSRRALGEIGEQKYPLQPVGTGPFSLEKWTPGSEVRLAANPGYFEGAPKIDGVLFRLIADETAAAVALENGEIDIFYALQAPEVINRLRASPGITVLQRAANHTNNLVLNMTVKPLDDLRVRRAIAYGMNRKALVDGFFKGTRGEGVSVLTPSFPEYSDDVPKYPYDPDKARALLKEAGAEGFSLDFISVAAHPYDQIAVPLAADLTGVGIKVNIKILERGAYLQARSKGEIPTCITGVVGPPDPDSPIITLLAKQSFPPGLNTAHYTGIEDLLAKMADTQDADARTALYRQMMVKTMTDVPVIPLYAETLFLAHTPKVQGLVQNSLFTMQSYSVSLGG